MFQALAAVVVLKAVQLDLPKSSIIIDEAEVGVKEVEDQVEEVQGTNSKDGDEASEESGIGGGGEEEVVTDSLDGGSPKTAATVKRSRAAAEQ